MTTIIIMPVVAIVAIIAIKKLKLVIHILQY